MAFHHELTVRYAECDMQGVVFNAHYLAYVDDAMSRWLKVLGKPYGELGWDCMVVHAEIDWQGPARYDDLVGIECAIVRWGRTSFVAGFDLHVDDRPVCRVELTYVSVDPGSRQPMVTPDELRHALDPPAA